MPARVTELVENLGEELAELADHRPLAACTVAQRLTAWSEHVLQLTATTERPHRVHAPWVTRPRTEHSLSLSLSLGRGTRENGL
jgi:hypothetical protein